MLNFKRKKSKLILSIFALFIWKFLESMNASQKYQIYRSYLMRMLSTRKKFLSLSLFLPPPFFFFFRCFHSFAIAIISLLIHFFVFSISFHTKKLSHRNEWLYYVFCVIFAEFMEESAQKSLWNFSFKLQNVSLPFPYISFSIIEFFF